MSSRPTSKRGASKAKRESGRKTGLSSLPGWLWLVTGLAAGFFVAFLFRLSPNAVDARKVAGHPVQAEKTSDPAPVFDFYTLLPESEVNLPKTEPVAPGKKQVKKQTGNDQKQANVKENSARYLLQAGSFRSIKDADRLRAQLLLWGLSPRVEKVNVGSGESWHRVQIGPFEDKDSLYSAQKILAEHNVDSLLLKMR